MMRKGSFKTKLILSYFLLIFISLGFVAFFLDKHLEEGALVQIKSALANEARLIESRVSDSPSILGSPERLDSLCRDLGRRIDSRITIIGMDGRVLADSGVPFLRVGELENH
ncbi:MAG: cell wall metabolism sensor histidine kinase WalK, partial [Candidatus Omnitrophica bacterium]|nr:cell wall metabolism sensor histidine kinase WalK [Candidatus Omnitrophota bacterium]